MAVGIRLSAEARENLNDTTRSILGIDAIEGLFVGDGVVVAHDIVNAPILTVEVSKVLTPEEYSRLTKVIHG